MNKITTHNNKVFTRLYNKIKDKPLTFISTNRDVGKSTFFYFLLLRKAIYEDKHFHIYTRYKLNLKNIMSFFRMKKDTYSKRQLNLLSLIEVKGNKLIRKADKVVIAESIAINASNEYKAIGNTINAEYAIFDEALPEDLRYCKDECTLFVTIIKTMTKGINYKVFCLYNNLGFDFIYKKYFNNCPEIFFNIIAKPYVQKETTDEMSKLLMNTEYKYAMLENRQVTNQFIKQKDNCRLWFKIYLRVKWFKVYINENGELIFESKNATKKDKSCPSYIYTYDYDYSESTLNIKVKRILKIKLDNKEIFFTNERDTIFLNAIS